MHSFNCATVSQSTKWPVFCTRRLVVLLVPNQITVPGPAALRSELSPPPSHLQHATLTATSRGSVVTGPAPVLLCPGLPSGPSLLLLSFARPPPHSAQAQQVFPGSSFHHPNSPTWHLPGPLRTHVSPPFTQGQTATSPADGPKSPRMLGRTWQALPPGRPSPRQKPQAPHPLPHPHGHPSTSKRHTVHLQIPVFCAAGPFPEGWLL